MYAFSDESPAASGDVSDESSRDPSPFSSLPMILSIAANVSSTFIFFLVSSSIVFPHCDSFSCPDVLMS